ncbi:MAG: hypothetical protein A3F16_03035 [Deltaproteobacteria bacterium RIFCSPHIGHO2_12_FULL_43_9]|nr:MAG: hypothetical protein A3F16_03035 [Deltaproteobacteria bacterium RIFCSPHIGHO2_12_FULL_43_9]
MRSIYKTNIAAPIAKFILLVAFNTYAEEPLPKELEGIDITEKFNSQIDLDIQFTTHENEEVKLYRFFSDRKPVLLTLNYYSCPTLCTIQLNALLDSLGALEWTPGKQFRVVTLNIDHREKPELAKLKRDNYLNALARGDVDWAFLVGNEESIAKLADEVGVGFRYDPTQNQYAHPSALIFLTPQGKVSRYLYGLEYKPRDIKFALIDASEGRIGSTIDKLILSCFHYDATLGRYSPFVLGIMRLVGAISIVLILAFLVFFWRREKYHMGSTRNA